MTSQREWSCVRSRLKTGFERKATRIQRGLKREGTRSGEKEKRVEPTLIFENLGHQSVLRFGSDLDSAKKNERRREEKKSANFVSFPLSSQCVRSLLRLDERESNVRKKRRRKILTHPSRPSQEHSPPAPPSTRPARLYRRALPLRPSPSRLLSTEEQVERWILQTG